MIYRNVQTLIYRSANFRLHFFIVKFNPQSICVEILPFLFLASSLRYCHLQASSFGTEVRIWKGINKKSKKNCRL